MSDLPAGAEGADVSVPLPQPAKNVGSGVGLIFVAMIIAGLAYVAWSIRNDAHTVGEPLTVAGVILLGVALIIALGFEFVNGFHDTANAVATVIYTNSMPPGYAVVWSGFFNFLGVMASTGAVAYGIVALLPVEMILQVGTGAGYAMIFALLLAAIVWNLGTWAMGIPNSSSHALIGSILGVGIANQMMTAAPDIASGIDWSQAAKIGKALVFSPLIGFIAAGGLFLALKLFIRSPKLSEAPQGSTPPPWWIRGLLILACTGVSFAHGGNDGQKGMGLIMIILIGVVPTTYALNRTLPDSSVPALIATIDRADAFFQTRALGAGPMSVPQARDVLGTALKTKNVNRPEVFAALSVLTGRVETSAKTFGPIRKMPTTELPPLRKDMFLIGRTLGALDAQKDGDNHTGALKALQKVMEADTRYIPDWVKVATALSLGLGTMVGWKRIVVTVGERIGKTQMTYGQGAIAGLVAAVTIYSAEKLGLPVSTTHILSSGVAGTMAANRSGLYWSTIRGMATAWLLTLPATILISGGLYFIFRHFL